jgi:hypothetical protein
MPDNTITGATENGTNDNPILERKRFVLTVIVIALWIALGILGILFSAHFYDLSIYFLSLTGFVGAYIISETKRPSISTSIFRKGKSSKREITIYITIILWLILGVFGIIYAIDLIEAATYFSALTPYVSTYLIGSAYKPDLPKSTREQMYQMQGGGMYGGGYWGTYGGYGSGVTPPYMGISGVQPPNPNTAGQTQQVISTPQHPDDP